MLLFAQDTAIYLGSGGEATEKRVEFQIHGQRTGLLTRRVNVE